MSYMANQMNRLPRPKLAKETFVLGFVYYERIDSRFYNLGQNGRKGGYWFFGNTFYDEN